jgi:hypothetical protein
MASLLPVLPCSATQYLARSLARSLTRHHHRIKEVDVACACSRSCPGFGSVAAALALPFRLKGRLGLLRGRGLSRGEAVCFFILQI